MLSWLPIVGPIIEGLLNTVSSIYNKKQDTVLARQQDDNKTDVAVIQTRAQVAIAFKDDLGVRLVRDFIMFPVGVWTALKAYYLCIHGYAPEYTWEIMNWPSELMYIPYAVVAFLFVTAWKGRG